MGLCETKEERAARLKEELESNKRDAIYNFWIEVFKYPYSSFEYEVSREDKTIIISCTSNRINTSECARYGVELEKRDFESEINGKRVRLIFVDKVPPFHGIQYIFANAYVANMSSIRRLCEIKPKPKPKPEPEPLPAIQENSTGLECPVCFSPNAKFVNVQCGHVCCCASCLNAIRRHGKCPKCRTKLSQTIKIYI